MRSKQTPAVREVNEHRQKIKEAHDKIEAELSKKGWGKALPEWLWIVYADGTDNKAEASKHWMGK